MTEYYLTFNNGNDFELYGDLKLGSKKLKQQDWFAIEPQTLSFTLFYFNLPQDDQQEMSNDVINSIFNSASDVNGIVQDVIVRLYNNTNLLFTGVFDLSGCDYDKTTNIVKLVCYDYLIVLKLLKEIDYKIEDKIYDIETMGGFAQDLQIAIRLIGFSGFDVSPVGTLSSYEFSETKINLNQKLQSNNTFFLPVVKFYYEYNSNLKYFGVTLFFYFNMGDIVNDDGEIHTYYEFIMYSFDGLKYYEMIREFQIASIDGDYIPPGHDYIIDEVNINVIPKINSILGRSWTSYQFFHFQNNVTVSNPGTSTATTYSFSQAELNEYNSTINIAGGLFSIKHSFGKFLEVGWGSGEETSIIDVLKGKLKSDNKICYANDHGIRIDSYQNYQTTFNILDSDILEIVETWISSQEIDDIEGTEAECDKLIEQLNIFYSNNIFGKQYKIKLLKSGIDTLKSGDRIILLSYDIDAFVISMKNDVNSMYFEIVAMGL